MRPGPMTAGRWGTAHEPRVGVGVMATRNAGIPRWTSARSGPRPGTRRAWRRAAAAVAVVTLTGLSGALTAVPANAAAVRTGTLALTPARATAGDTADVFTFTYTAPAKPQPGTISIDLPAGFSVPQDTSPSGAGYLSVSSACAQFQVTGVASDGAGGSTITVAENCAASLKATLIYALVTVPTTAQAYPVATSFTPAGGAAVPFAAQHAITVGPGALARITLSPATATITAGDSQAYTATGFDTYGNTIGTLAGAKFTIKPDGSCTAATCTATVAGTHTVTATSKKITATATLTVNPGPDLAVSQTVSSASPYYYAPVTFTTTITNTSTTTTADGVTAAVSVPAGLIAAAASTVTGSYASGTWTVGSLAPGATATLTITGDAGDVADGTQTLTATVTSTTIDPNPANNTASASEASQPAIMQPVATASPVNYNPVNVCAQYTQSFTASVVNAANPAAPPPPPGSYTIRWSCTDFEEFGCPPPLSGTGGNAPTISFDSTTFMLNDIYVIFLEVDPSGTDPNYQDVPTSIGTGGPGGVGEGPIFNTVCID